jgi:hypothetical protein
LGDFVYVAQPLIYYRTDPDALAMLKYQTNFALFTRRVRERYGRRARPLVRSMGRGYVTAWNYTGLCAMRAGDQRVARQAFLHALGYAPLDFKTTLRLARTFLPLRLARLLSGRTARSQGSDHML